MKRIFLTLILIFSLLITKGQDPVKLTNGAPAWIPNYLILDGSLYFRNGTSYTSLGDTLFYFVSKSDSSSFYYTPRQIDSVLNTKTFSPFTVYPDSIEYGKKAIIDTLISEHIGIGTSNPQSSLHVETGSIRTPDIFSKKFYISSDLDTTQAGTWKYYIDSDTLKWFYYNGSSWDLIEKTYK